MLSTRTFTDSAPFDQSLITLPPSFTQSINMKIVTYVFPSMALVKMLNSLELGTIVQQKDQNKIFRLLSQQFLWTLLAS